MCVNLQHFVTERDKTMPFCYNVFWYTVVVECGGNSSPLFHLFLEPHTFWSLFTMCYSVISPDITMLVCIYIIMSSASNELPAIVTSPCLEYCVRSKECIAHIQCQLCQVTLLKSHELSRNTVWYLHILSAYNFESRVVIRNHTMPCFVGTKFFHSPIFIR